VLLGREVPVFWRNLLSPYSKENNANGGNRFLQNVGTRLPNLTASYLEDFNLDFYVSLCCVLRALRSFLIKTGFCLIQASF
jgi:hypothetical protein